MELPPHLIERLNDAFNTALMPIAIKKNEKIIYGKDFCAKRRAIYEMAKKHDFYVGFLGTTLKSCDDEQNIRPFMKLYNWGFVFGYVKYIMPLKNLFLNCQYMFVLPEHRRQGHVTKFINNMKKKYMFINIPTSSEELINLCIKNGFRLAGPSYGLIEGEVEYRWCKHNVTLIELRTLIGYKSLFDQGHTRIPIGFRCPYDGKFVGQNFVL